MIVDAFRERGRYLGLHPAFTVAFAFAAEADLSALPPGRHEIDGGRIYLSIDHKDGRGRDRARLEAHRRYIDIQLTLAGAEEIGWRSLHDCASPSAPHDEARDIRFYDDRPESWIAVPPGSFAIFFPTDAHAPLAGVGGIRKAIFKIAVDI